MNITHIMSVDPDTMLPYAKNAIKNRNFSMICSGTLFSEFFFFFLEHLLLNSEETDNLKLRTTFLILHIPELRCISKERAPKDACVSKQMPVSGTRIALAATEEMRSVNLK